MDYIVELYAFDGFIGVYESWLYDSIDEMASLADVLNEGLEEPVWINVENGLPQLAFIKENK